VPENICQLATAEELLTILTGVDISVPGRTDGRTTEHTETWTISRLLSTLARADRLEYPLSVTRRDRPDCLIVSGPKTIGVEITEAVSPEYAAYSALAEREFPDVFLQPGHFRWGAPQMSVPEMRELLQQTHLSGPPWAGDRAEREWALFIHSVIDNKLEKLNRPGFEVFESNWLAIYDNLPLPHIHLADAITYLRPLLEDRWLRTPGFDTIFVEHGPVVAQIQRVGSEHLILHDLWQ
jgi:hypothetical protein